MKIKVIIIGCILYVSPAMAQMHGSQHVDKSYAFNLNDRYGIQAVKACAIDYLLKPINILELTSAVNKALEHIGPKKDNQRLKELVLNMERREDE